MRLLRFVGKVVGFAVNVVLITAIALPFALLGLLWGLARGSFLVGQDITMEIVEIAIGRNL